MAKKLGVIQSNYVPWKGYFDFIHNVDEFVILDDVQYTKNDWRNRNRIKTSGGVAWLTIPIRLTGRFGMKIAEAEISGTSWADKHFATLSHAYKRAKHFSGFQKWAETLYEDASQLTLLSDVNVLFLNEICKVLGIKTPIRWSRTWPSTAKKSERLIELCQAIGANEYVSGPSAKAYLDESLFHEAGIDVTYFEYTGYKTYPQLWGEFVHEVSVLDAIFNTGPEAASFVLADH